MMILRKFTANDQDAFIEMCTDFYAGDAANVTICEEQMNRTFQRIVQGSPYVLGYIIEVDGESAGYGLSFPFYTNEVGGMILMLDEIYVKPEYRSKGIGSAYIKSIGNVVDMNIVGLRLDVCPANPTARALYTRLGFRDLGYDAMVMVL